MLYVIWYYSITYAVYGYIWADFFMTNRKKVDMKTIENI